MGKFKDYDCGYTSVSTSPFNSLLMCNDFATLFTFIPVATFVYPGRVDEAST